MKNNELKRDDLRVGDIVVVETAWLGRPTVHYIMTELNGQRILCAFHGDVNCGERPSGWYEAKGELPSGTILVARPTHPYNVFSREYFKKDSWNDNPWFEILYKRDDAEDFLD